MTISSKLMRGTSVDFDDCLHLVKAHQSDIDVNLLIEHFNELVSYDISADRVKPNIETFLERLNEEGLV